MSDPATDPTADVVVATLARVLGVDPAVVRATDDLRTLRTFSSFRILDVVESLEVALDVEAAPEDLTATNLRSVRGLCTILGGAAAGVGRG